MINKKIAILIMIAVALFPAALLAKDVFVNGYFRSDGTYVAPHYRTAPNSTLYDNYSSEGNYNPYTGKKGTKKNEFSSGFYSGHKKKKKSRSLYQW